MDVLTERIRTRVRAAPELAAVVLAAGVVIAGTSAILSRYAFLAGVAGGDVGGGDLTGKALALAGGPQILGHTFINYALKDLAAATVSVAIVAKPVIATVLAFVLFAEVPSSLVLLGGAPILAGIYLVSSATRPAPVVVE